MSEEQRQLDAVFASMPCLRIRYGGHVPPVPPPPPRGMDWELFTNNLNCYGQSNYSVGPAGGACSSASYPDKACTMEDCQSACVGHAYSAHWPHVGRCRCWNSCPRPRKTWVLNRVWRSPAVPIATLPMDATRQQMRRTPAGSRVRARWASGNETLSGNASAALAPLRHKPSLHVTGPHCCPLLRELQMAHELVLASHPHLASHPPRHAALPSPLVHPNLWRWPCCEGEQPDIADAAERRAASRKLASAVLTGLRGRALVIAGDSIAMQLIAAILCYIERHAPMPHASAWPCAWPPSARASCAAIPLSVAPAPRQMMHVRCT